MSGSQEIGLFYKYKLFRSNGPVGLLYFKDKGGSRNTVVRRNCHVETHSFLCHMEHGLADGSDTRTMSYGLWKSTQKCHMEWQLCQFQTLGFAKGMPREWAHHIQNDSWSLAWPYRGMMMCAVRVLNKQSWAPEASKRWSDEAMRCTVALNASRIISKLALNASSNKF